jgi:hypothetical protein
VLEEAEGCWRRQRGAEGAARRGDDTERSMGKVLKFVYYADSRGSSGRGCWKSWLEAGEALELSEIVVLEAEMGCVLE